MGRVIDAAQDVGEDRSRTDRRYGPRSAAADHRPNDDGWISQAVYARSSAIAEADLRVGDSPGVRGRCLQEEVDQFVPCWRRFRLGGTRRVVRGRQRPVGETIAKVLRFLNATACLHREFSESNGYQ